MAETLTVQQRIAVENRGGSLLVSAAAGSGKTKVLVERLFRYVTEEGRNLDDFLIITYTRAAAAELRGKIAAELSRRMAAAPGDAHLRRQLLRVYQADIKTVDAFCAALLRENTHLLDDGTDRYALTPDFRVLDEDEAALLREGVLRRTLGEFYETLTPAGELLADTLGAGRDDRRLADLVLEVYGKLQSHAYPLQWLDRGRTFWAGLTAVSGETVPGAGEDSERDSVPDDAASGAAAEFDGTPYAAELLSAIRRRAAHWIKLLHTAAARTEEDPAIYKAFGAKFLTAASSLEPLSAADAWEAARSAAALVTFPRAVSPRGRKDDPVVRAVKPLWDTVRAGCKDMDSLLDISGGEAMEDLRKMAPAMDALLDLTARFAEAYRVEKLRLNAADFSDQEHLALKLLLNADGAPTELGRQTAGRYAEILVDEYQDTNEVQNAIFRAVSREGRNLFTVGDVKQSIYRFRLAEPGIFLDKYRRFTPVANAAEGEDRKLLLSRNFRSRREILDAANFVFSAILSEEMGEMEYGAEEALYFGAAYYPARSDCATEFHLISAGEDEDSGEDGGAAWESGTAENVIAVDFRAGRAGGRQSGNGEGGSAGGGENSTESFRPVKRLTAEARFTAKRIRDLLDQGFPVTEDGALRPCRPEDIVILMRAPGSRAAAFAQALAEQDIPCSFDEAGDFFGSMEVSTVLSLLETADNPRQDVPLISVLRSPLFGFSPDRLAEIRAACPGGDFYEAVCQAAEYAKPADSEQTDGEQNDTEEEGRGTEADCPVNADGSSETDGTAEADGSAADSPDSDKRPKKKPSVTEDTARACAAFLDFLSETRLAARDMGVHRLLWRLYNQLNIPGVFGAMDGGEERKENLMVLSRHAERFESGGYKGLFAFVTQLRRLLDADRAPEERTASGGGVKLMSIHRSKGLEFPIVILADLDHRFSNLDFQTPVLVHPDLGLGPRCVDLSRRIQYPTLAREALENRIRRENLAEEQRILYVAMTRPKEKLILVDSLYHAKSRLNKLAASSTRPVPPETVAAGRSFGDWLLLALLCRPEAEVLRRFAEAEGGFEDQEGGFAASDGVSETEGGFAASDSFSDLAGGDAASGTETPDTCTSGAYPWRVYLHHAEAFRDRPAPRVHADNGGGLGTSASGTRAAADRTEADWAAAGFDPALLSWRYPYSRETVVPAKVTATQLKGRALDDEIAENAAHTPYIRPLTQPKFRWKIRGLTPAERGTATHLVLQYLDFSDRDIAGQTARLAERHLLTEEQAAAVDIPALERFLASPLAEEIRLGRNVRREYPFTLLVDAREVDRSAMAGDQVLLQGVVDCCFETDAGVTVVDFKTDRIRDGEGARRAALYRPQLAAYSRALERVLERPVVRRVLFFLETAQAVEI